MICWECIQSSVHSAGPDCDLPGLGSLRFGQPHVENAVLQMRLDLIPVDIVLQCQDADEVAAISLLSMPDRFFRGAALTLPLEDDLISAGHIDLEVLLIDAG